MTTRLVALAAVLVAASFAACSEDPEPTPNGTDVPADAAQTGPDAGEDAGGQAADTGGFVPPVTRAACDTPTVAAGASVTASAGAFRTPRLAAGSTEAAVAWLEGAGSAWTAKLQRLSTAGAALGAPITLGTSTATAPRLDLASNGAKFLACFDTASGSLGCATVDAGGATAANGGAFSGKLPFLAFGTGGYVLGFTAGTGGSGGELRAVDAAGQSLPTKAILVKEPAAIVAKKSGYAVALKSGSTLTLTDYSAALVASRSGTISTAAGGEVALAAAEASGAESSVVVVFHQGSDVGVVVVPPTGNPLATKTLGVSNYTYVAAARGSASFAAVWSDFNGFAGYRAVALDGTLKGTTQHALTVGWDDNAVTAAAVADGFLVAGTTNMAASALGVAHLACP